jgi:prolyl-tRNA synthetase
MTHGDDNGLVLPPAVAPVQVVIVPVAQHKEGVLEKANELYEKLKAKGIRVKLDDSDNSPGWKFAEYEMKGVPVRIEIGPKDIENGQCVAVTRHNREKTFIELDGELEEFAKKVSEKLEEVRTGLYNIAYENRKNHTYDCTSIDEIINVLKEKGDGFVRAMWCGNEECEDKVKELTGVGSRCIPFEQETLSDKCVCCGRPAKKLVYWGKAY